MTQGDLRNASFARTLNELEKKCVELCYPPECDERNTITKITQEENDEATPVFVVNVPREPNMVIVSRAQLGMTEFVIYVFSICGTWFGLSALQLNPFDYAMWRNVRNSIASLFGSDQIDTDVCAYCVLTRIVMRRELRDELRFVARLLRKRKYNVVTFEND